MRSCSGYTLLRYVYSFRCSDTVRQIRWRGNDFFGEQRSVGQHDCCVHSRQRSADDRVISKLWVQLAVTRGKFGICPSKILITWLRVCFLQLKFTLFEGGVRTAAAVYHSKIKNKGGVSNSLFHISDWLPTLYAAAGNFYFANFLNKPKITLFCNPQSILRDKRRTATSMG